MKNGMKYLFFLIILLILPHRLYCQQVKSDYTNKISPDTVFHLLDGKSITLYGEINQDTFSDFILTVSGSDSVIDSWDGTEYCTIKPVGDTLKVFEIEYLPTGKDFKYQDNIWMTNKIYFRKGKIEKHWAVNPNIPKYSKEEINLVLKDFESSKGVVDDREDSLVFKLFIASISGSKKARICFNKFKSKFQNLDGGDAEVYENLLAMLSLWDEKKK